MTNCSERKYRALTGAGVLTAWLPLPEILSCWLWLIYELPKTNSIESAPLRFSTRSRSAALVFLPAFFFATNLVGFVSPDSSSRVRQVAVFDGLRRGQTPA